MGQIVLSSQVFHQRRTLGGAVQNLNDCDDQKQSDNESSAWWLRRHDAAATDTHNTILIFSKLSTSRMLYYISRRRTCYETAKRGNAGDTQLKKYLHGCRRRWQVDD